MKKKKDLMYYVENFVFRLGWILMAIPIFCITLVILVVHNICMYATKDRLNIENNRVSKAYFKFVRKVLDKGIGMTS